MTCFDRYLLCRFFQVLAILFVSSFGLFVVIDAFSNVNAYEEPGAGTAEMLANMGRYYGYQLFPFLEMAGDILSIFSVMTVLGGLARKSELYPLLAAGVPLWRLAIPLACCSLLVSGLLAVNQELICPQIAHQLTDRNAEGGTGKEVEPAYDYETFLHIDGARLHRSENRLERPQFTLLAPEVAREMTTVQADVAQFFPQNGDRPAGWLLKNARPRAVELRLTERGRKIVHATSNPANLFIATDISADQLHQKESSHKHISTKELKHRIDNPSFGLVSVKSQLVHLHTRLTRPIANLIVVFIAVPLIIRKESRSLLLNAGLCGLLLTIVFVSTQACYYLGTTETMSPGLAAWVPLIGWSAIAAWLSESALT